ncbi:MAG: cation transporter [Gammaproteobacteria bacterium HGW-Gammaproteobacteria-1]|jgi:cobalt-zinc-cadmium efflux system protein|nr:MAG: cation transporter [Gammaproteobacteria bacterium HGW-Gammaproteobacteria-1]
MHDHVHHHHAHPHRHALGFALLLTLGYAAVEAGVGLWSGSLALLGDAGHMVTDASALGIAALAARLALQPPSPRHSYGLGRIEVLAALLNALVMLGVVAFIAGEALERLQTPAPVQGVAVMVTAAIGLLINGSVAWVLTHGEATLNVRAALLHVMGDLLGSVAALAAGAVIWLTGWTPIDPLLALVICVLILYSTLNILREALHVMMEGVPLHMELADVGRAMAAVEQIRSVHDLHIWTLGSGRIALSAHVVLHRLSDWEQLLPQLERLLLERYGIDHVTLQPELTAQHVLRQMPYKKKD